MDIDALLKQAKPWVESPLDPARRSLVHETVIALVEAVEELAQSHEALVDYFANDIEGWERGYREWRRRAIATLARPNPL